MNIKDFATEFMANIRATIEMDSSKDFNEELVESILEYMEDSGEIGAPTIFTFKKRMVSLNAYDFNDEGDSLDLFVLIPSAISLGKIGNNKIDDALSRVYHFYKDVLDGKIKEDMENPYEELSEISSLIKSSVGKISTLRLYVLTNGLCEYNSTSVELEDGLVMEQNIWDMQKVYQQHCIKAGKEKIDIDFRAVFDSELQCLKLDNSTSNVDSYMAVIPGVTLARIYKQYHQALLEKNVRTFLQFKPKVNRSIKKTLFEEPEMFFSYNNGISATASEVETVRHDGHLFITRIKNLQIVNGGQTTGTIASVYVIKGADMSLVKVPMKLSVIKKDEVAKSLVDKISQYANSQTSIKKSDFSANDPYLVALENISRSEWIPNTSGIAASKWYFERTRGQYLDDISQLSGFNERMFLRQYPKLQKINKTDIAVYEICWNQLPYIASRGPEESYKYFVKEVKEASITVTLTYYRRIIAKAILFKAIDKLVKAAELGGYKSNMNDYLLAAVSFQSQKKLDLDYIWDHQCIQPEVNEYIVQLIRYVWTHLTDNGIVANPTQWARSVNCWEKLKVKLAEMVGISTSVLCSPETMVDSGLSEAKKEKMQEAWNIEGNIWLLMSKWAKANNYFTPMEIKMLFNFGVYRNKKRMFSFEQACKALDLLQRAKELGFSAEN